MLERLYGMARVIWAVTYNKEGSKRAGALILAQIDNANAVYLYVPDASRLGKTGPLIGDIVAFYARPCTLEDIGAAWECVEIWIVSEGGAWKQKPGRT